MKIVIAFCALCTIAPRVELQSINGQRRAVQVLPLQLNPSGSPGSYDIYIQEILTQKNAEAQLNKKKQTVLNNNKNINVNPNNDKGITFRADTNNGQSSYDLYIEQVLKEKNAEALANKNTDNNINLISGVQPVRPIDSEESPITSKPVRFVGEGKTDFEYLNNVTYALTNFGVNLMKSINALQTGNIIVSPTSIATVLGLLQQGTVGQAQNQITRTLQMTPEVVAPTYRRLTYDMKKRNSRNILTVSNNLYFGDGFEVNPDFKENAVVNFGSEVTVMDFSRPVSAVKQINKWVAIQTHNRIEELLPYSAVNHNTQLVIANAVYFKGLWETKFRKEATKTLIFHLNSGEAKSVPFMRIRHSFKYGVDEESKSHIAILPFERHQYSLILILPDQSTNVESTLNSLTNIKLMNYHNFDETEIQLELPKFTIKSDTDMVQVLKKMGVSAIFSRQVDLTGIGTYRTFSPEISKAIHTGYLSVDEQGLSAAGASGFAAVALSYHDPPAVFQANRPFLAVLWDTQFAIPLFIAKIEDPSQ